MRCMSVSSGCGFSSCTCHSGCVLRASSAERRGGRGGEEVVVEGKEEWSGRGMEVRAPVIGNGCCLVSVRRLMNLGQGLDGEEGDRV